MFDVMLDIETMSTHPTNALVLSVGVVLFEPISISANLSIAAASKIVGPLFGSEKAWVLDPREQFALGRQVDASTVKWWSEQEPEARAHWLGGELVSLTDFCIELRGIVGAAERVWANGICFDIGNVESLFRAKGEQLPWKYNAPRDSRTIRDSFPQLRTRPNLGTITAHNPVDDCIHQIWDLWEHWPALVTPEVT